MKQFDPDPIQEETREERQQHASEVVASIDVPKGHSVFTYDTKTAEVKALEYKKEKILDLNRINHGTDGEAPIQMGTTILGKVPYTEELIFFTALNLKNAKRRAADVDSFYKWLEKKNTEKENRDTL